MYKFCKTLNSELARRRFYDVTSHFNGEEIVGTFYEKELKKANHKELT